ncbi:MAG TPA: ubiquinol-cytochrome c reductase iron-sulfur subunit [bacterium]|nr:ubiquinol-cytochrome c reductase iron-sulfur subunit [bacterium]
MNKISHPPVQKPDTTKRRQVLNILLKSSVGLWLLTVFYPVYQYLLPPEVAEALPAAVKAGTIDELQPNAGEIVKFGSQPVILIRTPEPNSEYRAFSAICTHLSCIVQYRDDLRYIWCACHDGHYNLQGINIKGPPPRPLDPYNAQVKNNTIYITRNV